MIDGFGNEIVKTKEIPDAAQDLKNNDWSEKYRPRTIDDLLLPPTLKSTIKNTVSHGLQNMILHSNSPGTGKTTTAMAIADDLGYSWKKIDSSLNGRIATINDEIVSYAMQRGVDGNLKIVILDEVDGVTSKAFFDSLRGVIEWSEKSLRFIMTCNHIHKVDQAIVSRCTPISFNKSTNPEEESELKNAIYSRLKKIAIKETGDKSKVDNDAIKSIIVDSYPDIRSMIKKLQWNFITNAGEIKNGVVYTNSPGMDSLFNALKSSNWELSRKIYNDISEDPGLFFGEFLDYALKNIEPKFAMYLAEIVAEYQYRSVFQVNQEVNITCGMFPKIITLFNKVAGK